MKTWLFETYHLTDCVHVFLNSIYQLCAINKYIRSEGYSRLDHHRGNCLKWNFTVTVLNVFFVLTGFNLTNQTIKVESNFFHNFRLRKFWSIGSETLYDDFSLLNRKPAQVIIYSIWKNNNDKATQRWDCSKCRFEAVACAAGITQRQTSVNTGCDLHIVANNRCRFLVTLLFLLPSFLSFIAFKNQDVRGFTKEICRYIKRWCEWALILFENAALLRMFKNWLLAA